jgi:methanesulfonate monooxygenase subunit alpha
MSVDDKIALEKPSRLAPTLYIDNRIYVDTAIFEEERARIFSKVWNFVCHASELSNPGSFRTVSLAGYPLVVVRQTDSTIKAFYNICRHRQAQVVRTCSGEAKAFQCFYHHWTYGLDGRLTGVTLPEGYASSGFEKADFGLREVRADSVAGLIFVCLSDETEPLTAYLGEAVQALERQVPLEGLEVFHFHAAEINTNWKLFMDNNNEPYHTALHWTNRSVGTWGKPDLERGTFIFAQNGHSYTDHRATHYRGERGYKDVSLEERDKHLFPGLKANETASVRLFPDVLVHTRSTAMRIDHLIPIRPGGTLLESRGLGIKGDLPEVREMRIKHHNEIWGYSGSNLPEDIAATESQWAMMETGAVRYSVIAREGSVYNDDLLRFYYKEWSQRMGRSYWDPFSEGK